MNQILWRIMAAPPKQYPNPDEDCVFLAASDYPTEAFAAARANPAIALMEKRGMSLFARGSKDLCSTRWLDGSVGSMHEGVVVRRAVFTRAWGLPHPTRGVVRISAVVIQKPYDRAEGPVVPLAFDAIMEGDLVAPEEQLIVLELPDEVAAMGWCENQAQRLLDELNEEK